MFQAIGETATCIIVNQSLHCCVVIQITLYMASVHLCVYSKILNACHSSSPTPRSPCSQQQITPNQTSGPFKHLPHTGQIFIFHSKSLSALDTLDTTPLPWHPPVLHTGCSNQFKCHNRPCGRWQLVLGETTGIRVAHEHCSLLGTPPGTSNATSYWRQAVPAALAACQCTWYVGGGGQSTLKTPFPPPPSSWLCCLITASQVSPSCRVVNPLAAGDSPLTYYILAWLFL